MDLWLLVALGTFIILFISRWAQRRDAARKGLMSGTPSSSGDFNTADFSWAPGHHPGDAGGGHHGSSGDFGGGHHGASGDFGGGDSGGGGHH